MHNQEQDSFAQVLKEKIKIESRLPLDFDESLTYFDKFNGINNIFISRQWNEAKKNIKKWKNPRTLVQLGDAHLVRKNLEKAKKLYKEALDMDEALLGVYEKIILISLQQNKKDEANNFYMKLVKISNNRSDFLHKYILFKLFFFSADEKIIIESLNEIECVIKLEKNNFYFYNTKGFILLNFKNDIKGAKVQFENALKINPNFSHSLNNLGVCHVREDNFEKAKEYFKLAIKNDSSYITAYENLAWSYIKNKELKDALDFLSESLQKGVGLSEEWRHQVGLLLIDLDKITEAIEWYNKKIDEEPDNNLLYNNIGFCYLKLGNIKKAKEHFRISINIFRKKIKKFGGASVNGIVAFYNMGRVYVDVKDLSGMERIVKELTKYSPRDAFVMYLKGHISIIENDFKEAKKLFLEALKINENIPDVYPNLAFIYEALDRDYESAINCLEKALSKGFHNDLTMNNLAYAYLKSGKMKEAEKLLNMYKKNIPAVIFTNKGLFNFLKGNRIKGDHYYKKAIKRFSEEKRPLVRQHWYYETANFLLRENNINEARKFLEKAKKMPESYLNLDIEKLEKELS